MIKDAIEKFWFLDENHRHNSMWEFIGIVSFILSVVYWLFAGPLYYPLWAHHKLAIIGYHLLTMVVGYIASAFAIEEKGDDDDRKFAMVLGTFGLPGFIMAFMIGTFIRYGLHYPFRVLFSFQSTLLKGQDLINGKAVKQYISARKEKKAAKLKQKQERELVKMRVAASKNTAYRSPAPNCKECGQEIGYAQDEDTKFMVEAAAKL